MPFFGGAPPKTPLWTPPTVLAPLSPPGNAKNEKKNLGEIFFLRFPIKKFLNKVFCFFFSFRPPPKSFALKVWFFGQMGFSPPVFLFPWVWGFFFFFFQSGRNKNSFPLTRPI